jgi:hypothetical protein
MKDATRHIARRSTARFRGCRHDALARPVGGFAAGVVLNNNEAKLTDAPRSGFRKSVGCPGRWLGAQSRPVEQRAIVIVDRGGCDANTENDNLHKVIKEWCI